ncbi:MAG: four helix bundle protein [Fibrobacter sp.]|nr:four helix bundle protein [Fibrobacter sp.]
MRNFRELIIWKDAIQIVKKVYSINKLLPQSEKYGLSSQICRAAVSIPSNIAEGCSRNSQKDFKHFLEISLGSAFELETQVLIISELDMIQEIRITELIEGLHKLQAQINSLINKVK